MSRLDSVRPDVRRLTPVRILAGLFVVASSIAGFTLRPSDAGQVSFQRQLAGPGAKDCGQVESDASRRAADQCVEAAFRARVPFFVGYEVDSTDSTIVIGFVRTPDGDVFQTSYDSDPCGGAHCGERFNKGLCSEPRLIATRYPWVIECERPPPPMGRRRP